MAETISLKQARQIAESKLQQGFPVQMYMEDLLDCFDGMTTSDCELIAYIHFFDGWVSYEENAGVLIFTAIDGTLQIARYGYCVFDETHENPFQPYDISSQEAIEIIADLINYCSDPDNWPSC